MYFTFSGGVITDYDEVNGPKDVVIPDTIGGQPVTSIASPVWNGGLGRYVGSFANSGLTSVTIGDTVTTINDYAFLDNPLQSVTIGTAGYAGAATLDIGYGNFDAEYKTGIGYVPTLTSLYLGPVVRSIDSSFNNSLLPTLTLPDTIETIYNSFNDGIFETFTMGNSDADISYSFADNNALTTVTIGTVGSMNFTFDYALMLESVTIGTINRDVTTLISGGGGSWTAADTAPSLVVDIGEIGGTATNVIEDVPNLTSLTVDTIHGDVSYLVVGWFAWTIADTVDSLSVEVQTVEGSIDGFVEFAQQLTSVYIGEVWGDAEQIVQHDNDWVASDVSAGVDIEIGNVGGYLESVAQSVANLTSLKVGSVGGDIYGMIWGESDWTLADVSDSLTVEVGDVVGEVFLGVYQMPQLVSLTIDSIGGQARTVVGGGSSWTSASALPFDVTIGNLTGSLGSYVIDDSPTVRSFTIGQPNAPVTVPLHFALSSFEDSRSLEYLTLYANTVTMANGAFANMLIKEITVSGTAPLTQAVFGGNNMRTGEYIRVNTVDLTNPHGYQDTFIANPADVDDIYLAYIVNPSSVSIEYVDAQTGADLAPATTATYFGDGLSDYLIANNPVTDASLFEEVYEAYYRVGQTISVTIPSFAQYTSPVNGTFTLGAVQNNVLTLAYQNTLVPAPVGSGAGSAVPTAPNTGINAHSSSAALLQIGISVLVGAFVMTMGLAWLAVRIRSESK